MPIKRPIKTNVRRENAGEKCPIIREKTLFYKRFECVFQSTVTVFERVTKSVSTVARNCAQLAVIVAGLCLGAGTESVKKPSKKPSKKPRTTRRRVKLMA